MWLMSAHNLWTIRYRAAMTDYARDGLYQRAFATSVRAYDSYKIVTVYIYINVF